MKLTLFLDEADYNKLQFIAATTQSTLEEVAQFIVLEYLARQENNEVYQYYAIHKAAFNRAMATLDSINQRLDNR